MKQFYQNYYVSILNHSEVVFYWPRYKHAPEGRFIDTIRVTALDFQVLNGCSK